MSADILFRRKRGKGLHRALSLARIAGAAKAISLDHLAGTLSCYDCANELFEYMDLQYKSVSSRWLPTAAGREVRLERPARIRSVVYPL